MASEAARKATNKARRTINRSGGVPMRVRRRV